MKMLSKSVRQQFGIRSIAAALPLVLVASGALAGVFGTLPDPVVEDGKTVYTLGSSTSTNMPTYANAMAFYDYIDWAALNVPAGAVAKFNGAIVLDDLPDGLEYDWSGCTRLALVNEDLVAEGKKVVIPSSATALYYKSTVTKSEDSTTFTLSKPEGSTYKADVELNGELYVGDGYEPTFEGMLTGSGKIAINNDGKVVNVLGGLSFEGSVEFGRTQENERLRILSNAEISSIGYVGAYFTDHSTRGGPNALYFTPNDDNLASHELTVARLYLNGFSSGKLGANGLSSTVGRTRRWGLQLATYSNNTIRVNQITGYDSPCLGLFADEGVNYRVGDSEPTFDKGVGNFILEGNDRVDAYFVSPMANVTLTGNHGNYAAQRYFYYTVESNVVNRADILDFSGIGGAGYDIGHNNVRVYGYSPASLPHRIVNHKSRADRIHLYLSDSEWTMPFDFGAADVNPARCETDIRNLHIPSTGTVYVTNATTVADAAYPTEWTEYPVLTTVAGGVPTNEDGESVFTDWEVKTVGRWGQMKVEKVVKETGLYLRMRKVDAFSIIIR